MNSSIVLSALKLQVALKPESPRVDSHILAGPVSHRFT